MCSRPIRTGVWYSTCERHNDPTCKDSWRVPTPFKSHKHNQGENGRSLADRKATSPDPSVQLLFVKHQQLNRIPVLPLAHIWMNASLKTSNPTDRAK